jgi:hypothetical protein
MTQKAPATLVIALLAGALLSGCAGLVIAPGSAGTLDDLISDAKACHARETHRYYPYDPSPLGSALNASGQIIEELQNAKVFRACMAERGWEQVGPRSYRRAA